MPVLRMLPYRASAYTSRCPRPHTSNREVFLVSLCIIQTFLLYPIQNQNLLANKTGGKRPRVYLSSGSATQELSENAVRGWFPTPHVLTLLTSVLAVFSGQLFHPGVETAALCTKLVTCLLSYSSQRGILSFQHTQPKS